MDVKRSEQRCVPNHMQRNDTENLAIDSIKGSINLPLENQVWKRPLGELYHLTLTTFKGASFFILLELVSLAVMIVFPELVLWLPNKVM